MSEVAGAAPVRDEDAFDVERVAVWLRENASGEAGLDGSPEVQQFVGGASNLTYLLRYAGGPASGGRDLILRRPPTGTKAEGAHDMRREHDIQAALAPVFAAVPRMVAFCGDEAVIGSQFYVMERIEGTILRREVPPELGLSRGDVAMRCAAPRSTRSSRCTRSTWRRPVSPSSTGVRATCTARSRAGAGATGGHAPTTSVTSRPRWPGSWRTSR